MTGDFHLPIWLLVVVLVAIIFVAFFGYRVEVIFRRPRVLRISGGASRSTVPVGEFHPTMRVDVYFPLHSHPGAENPVKVAEAYTDGVRGELNVLDPRFENELQRAFTNPQWVMAGGATLEGGVRADFSRQLEPWQQETLAHLVKYELPSFNLRAEVVHLQQ